VVAAQALVLGGDAGGAVVEVADAQVLAAQRDHRPGAEAEAVGAEQRGLDHVEAGLQAAVGLQQHAPAQVVVLQRLARLGQAQFPRHAGVADRADRAGAGAAVVAGDGDQVGAGLGHAGGDRADARMADQLHRDQRLRIHLAQVEDQLREVLDRIDVVVRRRRDQADAGLGVAQPRDQRIDLAARQLAAFAGLGALRDLDLQHFGTDQVGRGHAEAAGGDLLDLAALLGAVARGVFAAFAGIAAPAEAVHRDRQRFVRFRRQRAQAHRRAVEAAHDRFDRLDLVQRQRRGRQLELQQVAQAPPADAGSRCRRRASSRRGRRSAPRAAATAPRPGCTGGTRRR
jgi:hypothetical protein